MSTKGVFFAMALCALLLGTASCDRGKSSSSDSTASASTDGSPTFSGLDKEAADAVMAQISKHWVKTADGWIAAFNSGNQFAPNYVRELREITVATVAPDDLDNSDKLNGVQWTGQVSFKKVPSREAGEAGPVSADGGYSVMRGKGHWSQWVDATPPPVNAKKVNGIWQVQQDAFLIQATLPTPADYQNAGVQP